MGEEGQVIGVKSNKNRDCRFVGWGGDRRSDRGPRRWRKRGRAGTFSASGRNLEFAPGSEVLLVASDKSKE